MERSIVGFVRDDAQEWVAELDCFHRQHVRHDPPFRCASWVLDDLARAEHVGTVLECPLCDRAELPDGLEVLRITESWNEETMPRGLRRAHLVAAGTWGRLRVQTGALRFHTHADRSIDVVLSSGDSHAIAPGVLHEVEPLGAAQFFVEFLGPATKR